MVIRWRFLVVGKTFRGIGKKDREKLARDRKRRQTAHHGVQVDKPNKDDDKKKEKY